MKAIVVPENPKMGVLIAKPAGISWEQAATLPVGAMTARYLWEKIGLKSGQKIMVYGAAGSVGSFALQLAKAKDCEVTAVCSAVNQTMARELGAGHVWNYQTEPPGETGSPGSFDIVFDAVGKMKNRWRKKWIAPGARYVSVKSMTKESQAALEELARLMAEGELRSYLDRTVSLEDVPATHDYVDSGRKRGNIAVRVSG